MAYVIRFWALALCFFLPNISSAQQTDSSTVALQPEILLRELVVQATRAAQNSPIPHNNLNADKLEKSLQAQDIPQLLTSIPSLVESSDAGAGIGYTGLRIRGSDPTRVNVTLNGVPLNDAESQGVYWVDLPDLAASAAEIQVQRGVGSSSNGAGAFGATVNIDLSRVSPEPGASVSGTIGAFGTRKISAQANTGILSGKWAFSGRASVIESLGYIDRASAELSSLHLSAAYLGERQTLQAHLLTGHEITYQAWNGTPAQYIDNEILRRYNSAGTEQLGEAYKHQVDDYGQQHILLHYKREFSPQISLQLNGHYTKGSGYYEQYEADEAYADYGLAPWIVGDSIIHTTDLVSRRWLDNDFYGGTFALRWKPETEKQTEILLGGALSRYIGRHFGEVIWSENPTGQPKDFRYYDNSADKRDANIFLKVERDVFANFKGFMELQGRVVDYTFLGFDKDFLPKNQTVSHFFFNPKIGATYALSDNWILSGFFGIAHREPNRDDYTQSSTNSRPKPERLADTEIGLRFKGENSALAANFFFMQYRDQLALNGRINDVGADIRSNVPDSYRAGLELEANTKLGTFMAIAGNLSLSQNKVKEFTEYRDNWDTGVQETIAHRNTALAFSPGIVSWGEATFGLFNWSENKHYAASKIRSGQVSLSISGKHVGKQFLDNTSNQLASLAAYFVSDLRLNVETTKIIGAKASLIFTLNNWLGARYSSNGWAYRYVSAGYDARPDDPYTRLEGGNVFQQAGFFPQAGRHWMATLRVGF